MTKEELLRRKAQLLDEVRKVEHLRQDWLHAQFHLKNQYQDYDRYRIKYIEAGGQWSQDIMTQPVQGRKKTTIL